MGRQLPNVEGHCPWPSARTCEGSIDPRLRIYASDHLKNANILRNIAEQLPSKNTYNKLSFLQLLLNHQ